MTVLLRRMLNGACWGITVALRTNDALASPANQTAILTATL